MRALAVLALALALLAAGCGGGGTGSGPGAPPPACTRFCLSASPASGPPGTVFVIRGTGWRPRATVTAAYGIFCAPGRACAQLIIARRLPTDARGAFTFRFRDGPGSARGLPQPAAAGGGPPLFEQRRVTRRAPYTLTRR